MGVENRWTKRITELEAWVRELEEENARLKQSNKNLKSALRTGIVRAVELSTGCEVSTEGGVR